MALEKVQVAVLAERLQELLEEVRRRGAGEVGQGLAPFAMTVTVSEALTVQAS